jgi:hypothetical protein
MGCIKEVFAVYNATKTAEDYARQFKLLYRRAIVQLQDFGSIHGDKQGGSFVLRLVGARGSALLCAWKK